MRASGIPVVNICQLIQRSALMLITKKSSAIKEPADFENKKISLWGGEFDIQARALFKLYGVQVRTIRQPATIMLFLHGGVDVVSAMWYNEYHLLLNAGFNPDELRLFHFADYGLDFPEDGIYCRQDFFEENPDLCRHFVSASIKGWQYAFDH